METDKSAKKSAHTHSGVLSDILEKIQWKGRKSSVRIGKSGSEVHSDDSTINGFKMKRKKKGSLRKSLLQSRATASYNPTKSDSTRQVKQETTTFIIDSEKPTISDSTNTTSVNGKGNGSKSTDSMTLKRKRSQLQAQPGKRRKSRESQIHEESDEDVSITPEMDNITDSHIVDRIYNSTQAAKVAFRELIHPIKPVKFFKELWERKPLLVKRHTPNFNNDWFSTKELDTILRENQLIFGENIDVVTYDNGKRETHNPAGRAYAPIVWDYYQNGCSVRILNPQSYSHNVWKKLALLQEFFGCMAGANIYLTPAGSQGFAPHYDDIEAFVLQLEGKKHWKLYNPRTENEELPRFSSHDFDPTDIGTPVLDTVLEAGDLLYFPRGVIHQASTPPETHSLHITVSCCQKNTWGDFLLKLIPQALQQAIESNIELRRGLPRDYLNYMGVVNCDTTSNSRTEFIGKVSSLIDTLKSCLPLDSACDQMAVNYMHDCLPPVINEYEKERSVHGSGERWNEDKMGVTCQVELEPDTQIKLLRKGVIRLVTEDDSVRMYHCLDNSRTYHSVPDPKFVEINAEVAPAVEFLIHQYPKFVSVEDLPLDDMSQKTEVVSVLYDNGLIITRDILEYSSDNE